MKQTLKLFALAALGLFVSIAMNAQLTTSTLSGKITDAQGSVPGAVVIAIHTPSGSQYHAVANNEGRYTIPGMRPGGPYEVSVQMMGYNTVIYQDITLQLSETFVQDVVLTDASEQLAEAVVVASASKFNTTKTGASTSVSNREMMSIPNSSRSISALTKLSPYANGMSFAGGDGRSTNFTVDGANLNNNFGLSSSLPGGGTPISLDALEEIQLVVAPFDVRQTNFVGGGINAVTKSGTNTFKGTAYMYYNDENFRGNTVAGEDLGERKASQNLTWGATLGGPIIKDKLFFFANFEMTKNPGQVIQFQAPADKQQVLQQIKDKLIRDYNYDPGSYTDYPGGVDNMKILARIDWNISDAHKLSLRYNNTKNTKWLAPNGSSCDDQFRPSINRSSAQSQPFSNNMYSEGNNVASYAAELNSRFSDNLTNRFIATYTDINDQRGSTSAPFPHIDIMTDGDLSTGKFIPYTSLGYELFTYNNGVKNKVLSVSDNLTYYAGNHTLTFGASYERQTASNSYMRNACGYYRFASQDDFLKGNLPISFSLCYGYNNEANPRGEIAYNQAGIYAQDEWNITDKFKLTYGLRADTMIYEDESMLTNNAILSRDFGGKSVDTGKWPKTRIQVSPRIGFNWDVNGDKSLVVRGGSGIFQGRLPLVFFTNMPQNAGMIQNLVKNGDYSGTLAQDAEGNTYVKLTDAQKANLKKLNGGVETNGTLITDVNKMIEVLGFPKEITAADGYISNSGDINGVDRNFRMPQIWKTSIAVDYQMPVDFPFTVTAEGMFNKTIYGVMLKNWNVNEGVISRFNGVDQRIDYSKTSHPSYCGNQAYVLTNTTKGWGYSANLTVKMTPVKNLNIMAAYTHIESKEVSGMPGSAASSAYQELVSVDGPNFATTQRSQYVVPDKVIANVDYFLPFEFFHGNGLHLNLYYAGQSSSANSFIYSNDMNGDGLAKDLIYIPATKDEISFKDPADADAFWKFVNQDKYLSKHKGEYAEANAARSPWYHRIDLRIAEDFCFKIGSTKHNFQISASFDNIGNMINSNWGIQKLSYDQSSFTHLISPLKYNGIVDGKQQFTFNKVDGAYPTATYTNIYKNTSECWQVLLG
ncbi:MAG: TonB-dependent receptor, partial [Bacteroidales bacterium]|nr:TonB-dependent receptor [Candidatus Cacconaster merdequi]